MARISVEEWRKQKEAENTQGTNQSSATTSSSSPSSSKEVSGNSSGRISVAEWRAQKATKSVQAWIESATSVLEATNRYNSKWHKKDDEAYASIYDSTSSLLAQADNWRKQYAGNKEAISAINSVVKALSDARTYSWNSHKFYSQWDSEDDYIKWGAYQTSEGRKERYASNQQRVEELKKERSKLQQTKPGVNPYTYGGATNPGMPYGASQQGGFAPTIQQQTATDRRLNEIEKEIASIESEMRMYERGNTDESGFYYGSKAVDDYGEYADREDFDDVSSKRNFRNAGREALTEYDAMTDSTTWRTDANNNIYDAFGNRIDPSNTDEKGNILHPYANNSKYAVTDRLGLYLSTSDAEKQEALGTPAGTEGTWESIIKDGYDGNWELLEENEVDIYYYLLNNSGLEAADKYLDDMKTELNRRNMMQATNLYKDGFSEANALERLALSIATTPAQMISGAAGFIEDAAMTVMGKEINPYSAAHGGMNFSQTVRGEQAEAWDEATGGVKIPFINFTVGDLYQSGMSAFDTFVGGKLGSGAYEVLMGMGAASTEAKRLYEQGASKGQIAWGGALAGAAEMVFEHASIENLINLKDADTVGQFVKNLLIQGGIEGSEEGFTDIANTITNALVMGSQSDWAKLVEKHGGDRLAAFIEKVQEVGKSAFGGFVSGSMGGTASSAASYAQVQSQNAELGQYISGANSTDALMALAQEMAKTASKGDQKNLTKQTERLGKDFLTEGGKNRATGRLYNTVRSVVTTQNISEISTALQEKGISKKDANAIAGAVAVQANGMELTDTQQKVLDKFSKNADVQDVVNGILGNNESGINQRARSVAKFEFDTMRNDIISRMKQEAPGQENTSASDTVDANKESSSETSYEVSADGKTILKSTGEIVNIKNVAAIKDGKVTLNLEDGSSVDAADVSFSSKSEAIFYDTVAQMDASVKAANILVNSFNALQGDSVNAEVFARGVSEAFKYGKLGLPSAALSRSKFAKDLTVAQQDYVYRQGKKAAGKQVAQQQAVVNSVFNEAKATAKSGTYQAVLEDGITALSLNESQKASYRLADNIAQAAKVNIHVYLGKTAGERGYYNPSTDEIWLNLNATNQSRQSMMAFALGHELVHRAKKGSPGKYQAFTEFLMKEYGKSGASVEAMIQEELDAAKEFGIKMTEEQAFEEVVCNACERMLLDTDAGKRLAEFGAQSKENKNFLEDLKRWISEFLDKLRSIFQDVDPSSLAAKEFAKFDANAKKILADMYVDMTIDAGEKLSTIQNAFGKGTVVKANKQGEFTMARSADGSKVLNNLTTWNNGGRETLEATLLREGYTEDEVKAALTIMDEKQKLVERIANEVNDNGNMAFPEQGRINEATLTTDLKDGHSVLSALVSNGDYPVNIDLLMVCKKRKAYQRVINRLCETGMIKQATVDALAIAEINKILGKYGFETACLGCFVESRRLRIQEWAQTIVKEWNAEVKKRNPKAKPFGFGKGEASLTPDEVMQLIGELESGGEKNEQGNLNLGQGSAVKRMGVLLDKVPTLRRTLSIEDLITPDGLTSLRQFDSNLFSMVKSRYGSNSPKFVQEFNPYNHELAKYGKVPTEYSSLREYLYAIGGARMQSFSDFIIENWFDYCQIVADLSARKLPMHTYTKEIALARLFGLTGIKINMSLIPDVDRSLGKEYAGLTRNAKGELELIWADKDRFKKTGGKSYMQSINFADAIALQEDPRYSANVGTIAVGISDMHIRMMLADPRIRMVIPYHSSGMNPIFADLMGTSYYKDYTNFQNTTVKQLYNSKGQPVSLKLDKTQTGKLTGGFLFNSVLQELGDARAAAEAYKEWCADASKHTITIKGETYTAELTPKFNDFSEEENYYKLLEDFNTYDCITEEAAPQGDVQQVYPEGFEDILRAELSAQEGHRQKQEANKSFDKAMEEIEGYLKNHTKADTVHYANQHGIKLGAKDKKLSAEDKARLKELQKQGVSFMLPKVEAIKPSEEQIESNIQTVAGMQSVYDVDASKLEKSGKKLADIFEEHFASWDYNIHSDTFGDIAAKNSSIRSELRHGFTPVKIASIEAIPDVIKSGEIIGWIEKNNGTLFRIVVAAPITIGETPYIMGVMLQRDDQHKRLYLHDVVIEKEASDFSQDDLVSTGSSESENLFTTSILQKVLNVKQQRINNLPVGEDTSPRALLSNALEAVTTNPIEKQKLQEYKEKVAMLNSEEQKLNELRKQIKKLSFTKGHYDAEKVRELQFEANMTANRINTFDRQLLRLEASKPLQNVLTREKKMAYDRGVKKGKEALDSYRERMEKQQQEIVERYQESRKQGVENRHKTIMRQKIRKVILDLDKILNRGDKKRNVKEDMKGFVAEALSAAEILFMDSYTNEDMVRNGVGTDLTPEEAKFMNEARAIMDEISNLPSGSYDAMIERQEQEQKLKGRLAYRMARLKGVFIRERARINKTQVSEVLGNLADSYGRLQNSEYAHVQGAYHENVHEYLKMLQEEVGGTIVKDMTLNQLEELYKAFTMVKTTVYNANRMFAENLNNTRDALANRVMVEVHEAGGEHGLWTKVGDRLNSFSWNNEKPVYAFERIGSKTLKTLYDNIRKGQDTWAVDLQEATDFRKALYEKYDHNTWDTLKTYKFTASSGIDFELNLDQIMSLYAYSKRAQAHDHLLKGGFVFDGNTEVLVNKRGLKIPYLNKDATAYNLSFEILEDIISKLTDEQKAFADEMQEYLSSAMGEKGNEISMQLYGVKLFNEKFYFPLRSAGQYMERAKEADMKKEQGQVNIANSGFSKATKIKASNPVVLSGFMDVWASHVNEMSMYHSFVLPMEDFRRVYNYSSPHMEGQQSASVNGVIQNAYGAAATDYIDKLYRDLNGGAITDNTTGVINKLMNLFKKGAVFASASVTVQQPSAIARATAMVDIKHFIGPKVDAKRHKALWEEVKKYAPVAIIKEMGFFDTNMGRSATDFLTAEEYSGIKEKAMALVKDESYRDELLSKAPALADELTWCVIWEAVKRETKSKHPGMDVKSEEFLKIAGDRFSEVIDKTQVYDSVLARSANMRSKDTGMKMATAFMAEPTTSANMIADALRKGKKGNKKQAARIIGAVVSSVILNSFLVAWVYAARDDDEDETFREKYISAFLSGIIDGVNPMTYIPFLKDIVSITQGYDVERSDMAVISDLWNAYKQLEKDNVSAWRKVEGFAGSICQIFGLPVKNIMRDLRSVYQAYNTIVNGEEDTIRGTAYAIVEGITGQKPSNPEQLYNSRTAGDTKHAARVEDRYDDEKSANAAVRKAITDRYMDGELTLAQATMQLTQYAGMKMDEAYWLMDSWKYKKETGSDDGYSKYNKFYEAVQTGKNLKAVIQEYTNNGVNKSTLSGQITEHFEPEYVEMSAGERANIKGYLINAYEQCGVSREKAEERLQVWDFKAKHGGDYDYSTVNSYLKPIEELGYTLEDVGISIDLYLEYTERAKECTGVDANGDGKADSNTIKNQKMDVINSMDLTTEQKDAMYYFNNWSKSKLKKAPWH